MTIVPKEYLKLDRLILLVIDFIWISFTANFLFKVNNIRTEPLNRLSIISKDSTETILFVSLNFMIFGAFIKFYEGFKLFQTTRNMSQYFISIMFNLFYFILSILMYTAMFSLLQFMNSDQEIGSDGKWDLMFNIILEQYQLIFGENPDLDDKTNFYILLYFMYTYMINIINLNLLISIIGLKLDDLILNDKS